MRKSFKILITIFLCSLIVVCFVVHRQNTEIRLSEMERLVK